MQYSSATRSGDFNNRLPSPNCQSRTTHDALPRFVTVSDPLTALTYTYDYAGRTDTVVTGGATRKYTYDRMGRNLTDTNQSTVGATAVLSTTNEWDNADRLTKRTTGPVGVAGAGAGVETFGYDQASRLTSWTNQANVTTPYTWSAASNRTAAGANTFTYNERNQLTTQTVAGTTSTYTYQPNGALASTITGAVTTARNYDGLGRQTLVGATSYTYDALGRLTGAGSNTLGYAGLEQEPVVDNAVLYTRTPNGTINASKTGVTAALVTTNIHGDIAATINPTTGTVTGRRTYDPTGVPILTTTVGNTGYQAQYTDPATAEIHTQTRNYQPTSARFTTSDTWTLPATSSPNINRYTYANANPITNTDPTVHFDNPITYCLQNPVACVTIIVAAPEAAGAAAVGVTVGAAVAVGSAVIGVTIAVTESPAGGTNEDANTAAHNAAEAQDALYRQTHGCGNRCGTPSPSPTPRATPGCGPATYPCGSPPEVSNPTGPTYYQIYTCGITPADDPGPGAPPSTGGQPKPTPKCQTNCTGTPKPTPKPIGTVEDPRAKGVNGATATGDPTGQSVLAALATAVVTFITGTAAASAPDPQPDAGGARKGGGKQPPECRDNTSGLPDDPHATDAVDLSLKYKSGWSPAQIAQSDAKVAALNESAQDGRAVVSTVQRSGTSASARYTRAGNTVPSGFDVDHLLDLQLGGADTLANMLPLDSSVNRSLGAQIRGLPVGTRIGSVSIC